MSFAPHGERLIAGEWIGAEHCFPSVPVHCPAYDFSSGTVDPVNRTDAITGIKTRKTGLPETLPPEKQRG
ncbi:hypothetical protein [Paracoccus alkanivorans]|uniref:Uncharacterized protein n=1 Tax=Paracoccus alkanivorans TaxID=2116655 RepID=A0A3M0M7N1_9RHOB|nr:hypothetical protein [Paracoccus alkanivorans]RMC33629.1 hypothetical protein C9E81_15040 [Paracoccus alkanivorans]